MLGESLSFIIDWQSFCQLSAPRVSVAVELKAGLVVESSAHVNQCNRSRACD